MSRHIPVVAKYSSFRIVIVIKDDHGAGTGVAAVVAFAATAATVVELMPDERWRHQRFNDIGLLMGGE
jgi:hypothetical protein